jgi:transcriptional regulator with XRE-family HTH domain
MRDWLTHSSDVCHDVPSGTPVGNGGNVTDISPIALRLLNRLRAYRERAGISTEELAAGLILGPGWIERFESGQTLPDIDTLFVLTERIGVDAVELFKGLRDEVADASPAEMSRMIRGEEQGSDLLIHFRYTDYDASYLLKDASVSEFEEVLKTLRDGLARLVLVTRNVDEEKAIKTNAVAAAFLKSIEFWPEANPSDLWWFVIYRAFCDPYNHPARYARLSFEQSWKRTGGWALEEILVRHYSAELSKHSITIEIAKGARKEMLLSQLSVGNRFESDKVDIVLVGPGDICFGVVHVKASFAERRTDDVPMSEALIRGGYCSPLWTMDCKSVPSVAPINRGELGGVISARSAKRKDIEDDGYFSACFSYNRNTKPTPGNAAAVSRVYCCDFSNPDDSFTAYVAESWLRFSQKNMGG